MGAEFSALLYPTHLKRRWAAKEVTRIHVYKCTCAYVYAYMFAHERFVHPARYVQLFAFAFLSWAFALGSRKLSGLCDLTRLGTFARRMSI